MFLCNEDKLVDWSCDWRFFILSNSRIVAMTMTSTAMEGFIKIGQGECEATWYKIILWILSKMSLFSNGRQCTQHPVVIYFAYILVCEGIGQLLTLEGGDRYTSTNSLKEVSRIARLLAEFTPAWCLWSGDSMLKSQYSVIRLHHSFNICFYWLFCRIHSNSTC